MTSRDWVVVWCTWNFASKFLKSLALGFWDQQSGEATQQHEKSEDLHDVIEPWSWVGNGNNTLSLEGTEHNLSDDSTDFARGSRDTVGGRSVTCWETFTRNDKRCSVRSEVEEELAKDVQSQEPVWWEMVVSEANDDK